MSALELAVLEWTALVDSEIFLAGEAASLMAGSVVVDDGGYSCW